MTISLSGDAIAEVQIYLDGEFITHTADLNYQIDSIDASKDHQIRVVAISSDKSRFTPSESTFTAGRYYYPTPELITPTPEITPEPLLLQAHPLVQHQRKHKSQNSMWAVST
ncbi:hypothetical protein FYJ51_07750 [Erysipelotrichaceae bacterium Oil+RF-744-GAM-WT-6]|uniref:Uncharacterized protein n=1 Tax=Stecheria intestinalis TaxID=2606630 RepID=A0A7X2NST9_9FIRM|nr:hypothetical protein [Stecheria intestinalis]MSS58800.1 hypothetical protein [Stecheria intestinalis]